MARHRHHHHHHHNRHRHNPFGLSANVVTDSAYNAAGALGSMFISSKLGQSGWTGVAATAGSAIGMSFVGKFLGGTAGEEMLKGGLTATIIAALHQAGFAGQFGLGSYAPSWFGIPTASSQYLRAYGANMGPAARGQGTILIPSANGSLMPAAVLPGPGGTPTAVPVAALPGGVSPAPTHGTGMGYHRFRSRYAGNY